MSTVMGLGPQGGSKEAFGICQLVLGLAFLVNDIDHIYSVDEENETGIKSRSTTTNPCLDLPGYVDVPLELCLTPLALMVPGGCIQ